MDINNIKKQIELGKDAAKLLSEQNSIFEKIMDSAIKGVEPDQKTKVEELKALSQRAFFLAKKGKSEEAKQLIKNFK